MMISDEAADFLATWKWGQSHYTKERSAQLLSHPTRQGIEHRSDQARAFARGTIEELLPLLAPQPVASQERVAEVLYTAMCKTGDDCEDLAAALLAAGVFVAPQPVEVVVDHRPGETCSVAASVDPDTGFSRTPQPVVDREALAKAAHHYFCIRRSEPNHDPRQSDYDKADEILEILALIDGTAK